MSDDRRGVIAGLMAVIAWATYNVGTKLGAGWGFHAADLAFLRFTVAGLIMLPVLLRAGIGNLAGIGWWRGLALTLAAGPLFSLCVNTGFILAPLAHGVIIAPASTMLATILMAQLFLSERLTLRRLVGMAIMIVGLLGIGAEALVGESPGVAWGDVAFVATGIMWAAFTTMLRHWQIDPIRATAVVSALSMAVMVPVYAVMDFPLLRLPAGDIALQAFFQGMLGGVMGVLSFGYAVRHLGASRAALFPSFVPVAAIALGIPLLGAVPTPLQLAGVLLSTLGLLIALGVVRVPSGWWRY